MHEHCAHIDKLFVDVKSERKRIVAEKNGQNRRNENQVTHIKMKWFEEKRKKRQQGGGGGGEEAEKTNQFYIGHFPSFLRLYMYIHLIAVALWLLLLLFPSFLFHFSFDLSVIRFEGIYMFLSQSHKWCFERRTRIMLNGTKNQTRSIREGERERVKRKNREKEKLKWFEWVDDLYFSSSCASSYHTLFYIFRKPGTLLAFIRFVSFILFFITCARVHACACVCTCARTYSRVYALALLQNTLWIDQQQQQQPHNKNIQRKKKLVFL